MTEKALKLTVDLGDFEERFEQRIQDLEQYVKNSNQALSDSMKLANQLTKMDKKISLTVKETLDDYLESFFKTHESTISRIESLKIAEKRAKNKVYRLNSKIAELQSAIDLDKIFKLTGEITK